MGITPPNKFSALGDPTRWGATVVQNTPNIDGVTVFGGLMQTGQILNVQCRDGYPRAWTLAGTIQAPAEFFLLPNVVVPAASWWVVAAYVSMGVGQVQIVHSFNLRAIIDADSPFYWNSDISNPFFENAGAGFQSEPFVIPGALVGTAMNVQILQSIRIAVGAPGIVPVTTSLIVTPFDAGVTPTPPGAVV